MGRRETRERLRQDITVWFADGIIDEATLKILQERYESRRFGWIGVVKYIGITGGLLAFFGIVGLVTAMVQSGVFAAIALGAIGAAITWWGMRMAGDGRDRYAVSSKVVLTLGCVLWIGAIGVLAGMTDMNEEQALLATGAISLPITFFLAYRGRNQYLLVLVLLAFFHWIGAWHAMWGRSSYVFSVQDPKIMTFVALAAIAVGVYHERRLYPRTGRFYLAWESLGLLYMNMSLLILSIWSRHEAGSVLWILVFTGATITQLVLGAAWQNGLLRGFGITFLAINLFTRFHEAFWDQLQLGQYLLAGGGLLVVLGACTEFAVRTLRGKGGAA
jgi:uncharacterized membrane protein